MKANLLLLTLPLVTVVFALASASTSDQYREVVTYTHNKHLLQQQKRPPTPAGAYLDALFDNYLQAQMKLTGNFTKRSKVAVVYMCYERAEIIRSSFAALLRSKGLEEFDFFVSQDGGSEYVLDVPVPANVNYVYIRHPHNLCTGLHHYFVKAFAFDIYGYEGLIVIEEDNVVHPEALQMLRGMLEISVPDLQIGLVSITDMDNSLLVDEKRYNAGYQRAEIDQGHLWVYAVHTSRYSKVAGSLREYYDVIKCHNYRNKAVPPLRDEIIAVIKRRGLPENIPLSQDAFFVNSLLKQGFTRRFTTMVRLYEPVGWQGLHFDKDPTAFYSVYGRGMYEGKLTSRPFEVAKNPADIQQLETDCRERLDLLYQQYLGREADQRAANTAVMRLLTAKLNAVQLMHNVVNSPEFRRRMKSYVYAAMVKQQTPATTAQ